MKKINVFLALLAVLLMIMTGCGGGGDGLSVTGTNPDVPEVAQAMTGFSINGVAGTIDQKTKTIKVILPLGTNLKALIAEFEASGSVTVNGVPQTSGVTANDFTGPVVYVITLPDGTTQSYTVNIKRGLLEAKEGSSTVIDPDKGFLSGLKTELTKNELVNDFLAPLKPGYHLEYEPDQEPLGTGTKVKVVEDGTGHVVDAYTILIYGDVTGDGKISALDALKTLRVAKGLETFSDPAFEEAGDVNGNGFIDEFDARIILDASSGVLTINQVTGLPTDFHIFPKTGSTTMISNDMIAGLETGLTQEKFESDYIQVGDGYRLEYEYYNGNDGTIGTGTKVKVVEIDTGKVDKTYHTVIYGDVTGDGNIDANDAGMSDEYVNSNIQFDEFQLEAGDVTGDGNVDIADAAVIEDVASYIGSIDQTTGLFYQP